MKYKLKRLHNKKYYFLQPYYTCIQCNHLRNCQCMYLDSRYEFAYHGLAHDVSPYICKNFERVYRKHNVIGKNWRKYYDLQERLDFKNSRPLNKIFVAFKEASFDRKTYREIKEADPEWTYYMSLKNFVEMNWYRGKELNWDFRGHCIQKQFSKDEILFLEKNGYSKKHYTTFVYETKDGRSCTKCDDLL